MEVLLGMIALIVGFGGGWYCKGKFGTEAATLAADVKKL